MLNLVRRARRRLLYNELLAQGANVFSAALLAFALLLILGTQVLSWQWLLPIPVAAVVAGLYLTSRRLPSPYGAARIVDHRLALADTVSTAFYFSQNENAAASPDVRRSQSERAQQVAESVDVRQAVPFRWPRTIYAMLALLLVAVCLFGLRYGLSRTLDLKPPLAHMLEQQFGFEPKKQQAKNNRRSVYNPLEPQQSGDDAMADPNANSGSDQDNMTDEADAASQDLADQPNTAAKQDAEKQADGMMAGDDMDAQAEPQADPMGEKDGQGQQGGSKSDQAKQSGNQQGSNSNGENSLLSKVKDAMQNLLSKMKPPPPNPNSQQQAGDQNSGQQNGKGQSSGKQQASKDGQKGEKAQQGEAQDGQNGEMAENGPEQQGKGNGKTDSQNKQAGSGAGSQDGEKNVKQAAQLAAMGKISEILGKRSANITGEATIEVEATSQQLHTSYSTKDAQHAQSGGEINRDEVPVALQPFVEQYFEQVRKQAAPVAPAAKK